MMVRTLDQIAVELEGEVRGDGSLEIRGVAGIREALPVGPEVSLRINISWHVYMPACSTTPWQLDAVIAKLLENGHAREKIYAAQNRTVVVDCRVGAVNNNLQPVLDREAVQGRAADKKRTDTGLDIGFETAEKAVELLGRFHGHQSTSR